MSLIGKRCKDQPKPLNQYLLLRFLIGHALRGRGHGGRGRDGRGHGGHGRDGRGHGRGHDRDGRGHGHRGGRGRDPCSLD